MNRILRITALLALPLALAAQEETKDAKGFFVQVGVNKIDSGADGFTVLAQVGVPIVHRGLNYVGIYAGGTQWKRSGSLDASTPEGELTEKSSYWGGVYFGDQFLTYGAAAEFGKKTSYQTPSYGNAWYDAASKNEFGANAFIAFHWKSGFGAFVRAGSQSGIGAGLSLNF